MARISPPAGTTTRLATTPRGTMTYQDRVDEAHVNGELTGSRMLCEHGHAQRWDTGESIKTTAWPWCDICPRIEHQTILDIEAGGEVWHTFDQSKYHKKAD